MLIAQCPYSLRQHLRVQSTATFRFVSVKSSTRGWVSLYEWLCSFEFKTEKYEKGNEKEWFFISERTKTGKGGRNTKRGSNGGYWNSTVATKKIYAGNGMIGYKSALEYYVGKKPKGVKGDWLMHEYWFESSSDVKNDKKVKCMCVCLLTWFPSYQDCEVCFG